MASSSLHIQFTIQLLSQSFWIRNLKCMIDWLKATAAAFTAVSALVGIYLLFLFRYGPLLDARDPDDIQDCLSHDGNYVATVETESGGRVLGWHCTSVLIHPVNVSTEDAIKAGKRYLVLGGDCDANIRWESPSAVKVEILGGNYPRDLRDRAQGFVATNLNRIQDVSNSREPPAAHYRTATGESGSLPRGVRCCVSGS